MDIPYIVHESMLARQERTIRRLFIIIILLIILLVGTNLCWLWYESQFEDVSTTTVEADTENGAAIANLSGEVQYGESKDNGNQIPS